MFIYSNKSSTIEYQREVKTSWLYIRCPSGKLVPGVR